MSMGYSHSPTCLGRVLMFRLGYSGSRCSPVASGRLLERASSSISTPSHEFHYDAIVANVSDG